MIEALKNNAALMLTQKEEQLSGVESLANRTIIEHEQLAENDQRLLECQLQSATRRMSDLQAESEVMLAQSRYQERTLQEEVQALRHKINESESREQNAVREAHENLRQLREASQTAHQLEHMRQESQDARWKMYSWRRQWKP